MDAVCLAQYLIPEGRTFTISISWCIRLVHAKTLLSFKIWFYYTYNWYRCMECNTEISYTNTIFPNCSNWYVYDSNHFIVHIYNKVFAFTTRSSRLNWYFPTSHISRTKGGALILSFWSCSFNHERLTFNLRRC